MQPSYCPATTSGHKNTMADFPARSSSRHPIPIDSPDEARIPRIRRKKTQSIFRLATTLDRARQPLWSESNFGCRPFPPGLSKFRREPRTRRVLRSVISRHCRPCPLLFPNVRGSTANLRPRGFPRAAPAPIAGHMYRYRQIVRRPARPVQPKLFLGRILYSLEPVSLVLFSYRTQKL